MAAERLQRGADRRRAGIPVREVASQTSPPPQS